MKHLSSMGLAALMCLAPQYAAAQYPEKSLRFIVPLAPGTGTDGMARFFSQKLADNLGQPVVVENRPGAGATIGTGAAARAAPDGYTLYMGGSVALTISPALYGRKLQYDGLKDFTPVSLISRFYLTLVTHPSMPVHGVKDLIKLAQSRPGELVLAAGGVGSTSHLTGALFQTMAKVDMSTVQYKGGGASMLAIMTGESQIAFTPVSVGSRHARGGKLRLVAVSSPERIPSHPKLEAIAETLPGFEWSGWQVVMVPAGTPEAIVERLHDGVRAVVTSAEFGAFLDKEGSELFELDRRKFPEFLRAEMEKNARLVKLAGARPE
jgi:tripartite-type tricarboxylate transporter receptor subunit TctC